jgi:NitT/TauT family transport system substrate-binding protein
MLRQRMGLLLILLPLACAGCGDKAGRESADTAPQEVTLALNWFPEAEHGGFYAAEVHGYFREQGLRMNILPGGPGAPVIQQVAMRRVNFAVATADQVLLGRDQGAPVVAVLAAMQDSPRCIMVHAETGIRSLRELKDLTLAVGSGKPFAQFLLHELGNAGLTIVPYQGNVTAFLQRKDLAQQAYVFSEPHIARQAGADPRCLMVSELGFNPYSSVLITSEQGIAEQPELVAQVVRACRRGWQTYLESPSETNEKIHSVNAEMPLEALQFGADALRALCLPPDGDASRLGTMSAERWETLADQLHAIGLLKNREAWRGAFDTSFLE